MPRPPEHGTGTERPGDRPGATIRIEIAWVTPEIQDIVALTLPAATTVDTAIAASRLADVHGFERSAMLAAVRGRQVAGNARLADGDRVDLCRPLQVDPKEARRRRASGPAKT